MRTSIRYFKKRNRASVCLFIRSFGKMVVGDAMKFTKLSVETKTLLENYMNDNPLYSDYYGSELMFQNLAVWKDADAIETAEVPDRYLIVRSIHQGMECFFPPVARNWDDFDEALRWMEADAGARNIPFIVRGLTERMAEHVRTADLGYAITEDRDLFEYLYNSEELRTLSGKKFHNKRNLVNQFAKQNDYVFRPYEDADYGLVLDLLSRWEEEKLHAFEHQAILKTLDCLECYGCFADLLLVDHKVVAFAIGTKNAKMGLVLFEKADTDYTGSYAAINQWFAQKHFADVPIINRQEDIGVAELRRAKMSYNPIGFAQKFTLTRNRLREDDVSQLQSLYHEAFGDSEGFRQFFFNRKYASANVVYRREGGQIVSALHFVSKTWSFRGQRLEVPYVVAAATRKDWRGKGLMREVLDQAFQELRHRNLSICALSPFSEAYYRKSGFVTIHRQGASEVEPQEPDPFTYEPVDSADLREIIALYEQKTAQADLFVLRTPEDWHLFAQEVQADDGQILLVREKGIPVGYFTLFGTEVEEVCFPNPAQQKLSARLYGLRAPVFGPDQPHSHTMIRIVDLRKWLSEYPYPPTKNGIRRLRIVDSSFPAGTMTLELAVRNGKAAVREIEEFEEEITLEKLTEEIFLSGSDWLPKPTVVLFDKY